MEERLAKFQKEVVKGGSLADYIEQFQASEKARRNALYGGHSGAIYCDVKVKRRDFPILYEIRCSISAKNDLSRSLFMEYRDIGFSTPDHIIGGIKTALTDMLKDRSSVFSIILRYKK